MAPASNQLLRWRSQFPILERTTYLISNSLGAMPAEVRERLNAYADTWATRGVRAWEEGWWQLADTVAAQIAPLLGAPAGNISLHQNVTLTQAVIASCFDFTRRRNKIVMVDLEFPSILYFYLEQRRLGARVEIVKSPDLITFPTEAFLRAIDRTTALVPISLVLFRSSTIVDARAIIQRAHQVGARVVLDVFQATGSIPVDVAALEVDFAVGGVLKWLCGGPGVAYLYVRPDLRAKLKPRLTGWMAHEQPFAFAARPIRRATNAYGWMNGTPAIPALHACQPGLQIVAQAGIAAIRKNSLRQTARLLAAAAAHGWPVSTPQSPALRAGTVSIACPGAAAVAKELLARDIVIDYRPHAGIRVSPHFYNTDAEMDHAIATIAACAPPPRAGVAMWVCRN